MTTAKNKKKINEWREAGRLSLHPFKIFKVTFRKFESITTREGRCLGKVELDAQNTCFPSSLGKKIITFSNQISNEMVIVLCEWFPTFILHQLQNHLDRFLNDCRKTSTSVITPTGDNWSKQRGEDSNRACMVLLLIG